jgi:hypothetical protein
MKKFNIEDKLLYYLGIFSIVIIIIYFILSKYFIIETNCFLKTNFNIYCPLCGGTRATILLFQGELLKSIYYNPIVIYTILLGSIFMIKNTIAIFFNKIKVFSITNKYLYIFLIILTLNFLIKNYFVVFKNIFLI